MSYNQELQSNNAELEEILQAVNDLPEAGGNVNDAVLFTKQELTEEQQAQARENIGFRDWTLVGSVVTTEKVSYISIAMGEHKIKSDRQQLMVDLVTPPNKEASGMCNILIEFTKDGVTNGCWLFHTQASGYGGIEQNFKIYSHFETKFIGRIAYTERIRSNYNSNAYPQPSYSAVANHIYPHEIGSEVFNYLTVRTPSTQYPHFPIGTEVYVYVR